MLTIDRTYINESEETIIKFLADVHPGLEVTELRAGEGSCCWIRVPESFFDDPTAAYLACWKKYQGLDENWEVDNLDSQEAEAVYENMLLPEIGGYEPESVVPAEFTKTIKELIAKLPVNHDPEVDDGWFRDGKPISDEEYLADLVNTVPKEVTLLSKDETHQYYFAISGSNYLAFFSEA